MENVSNVQKEESIKSLQSTIRKLESAFSQMTQKGSNTTLVKTPQSSLHRLSNVRKCLESKAPSLHPRRFSRSSHCSYSFASIN